MSQVGGTTTAVTTGPATSTPVPTTPEPVTPEPVAPIEPIAKPPPPPSPVETPATGTAPTAPVPSTATPSPDPVVSTPGEPQTPTPAAPTTPDSVPGVPADPAATAWPPPPPRDWRSPNNVATPSQAGQPSVPEPASTGASGESSPISLGVIIGAVVAIVAVAAIVAIAVFAYKRRKWRDRRAHAPAGKQRTAVTSQKCGPHFVQGDFKGAYPTDPSSYAGYQPSSSAGTETLNLAPPAQGMPTASIPASFVPMPGLQQAFAPLDALVVTQTTQGQGAHFLPQQSSSPTAKVKCDSVDTIEDALDAMAAAQSPLMGRWLSLGSAHRRVGGQGVVQFMRDGFTHEERACKLFLDQSTFANEAALYARPDVKTMMAAIVHVQGESIVTAQGYALPPFIVLERGQSLDEWARAESPDFATSLQVLTQIVKRLQLMHESSICHRDLKPANILWRYSANSWTLIDFGCAQDISTQDVHDLSYSLAYAPPEVVRAVEAGESRMRVTTAMDMFSLGVVIYELLMRRRVFPPGTTRQQCMAQLAGREQLPWERNGASLKKLGVLKELVLKLLSRDPAARPTADQAQASLKRQFIGMTTSFGRTQSLLNEEVIADLNIDDPSPDVDVT